MANQEHLDLLRQGVEIWNQWREEHLACKLDLSEADLKGFDLSRANLARVNLSGAQLREVNFSGAYLMEADLSRSNLSRASLGGAYLLETNLWKADLSWAKLDKADLSWAILDKAILCEADLTRAILRGTSLQEANLTRAVLSEADLRAANLTRANLTRAILSEVDLSEAILCEADLTNVHLSRTVFAEIDLCAVKGLMKIDHRGPSLVQMHTVKLPLDSSALYFLRGTGVPDEWIDSWRATMMYPIQYHSCFISYSSKDEVLARRLHADLQENGVRCWFAPEDMKIGDEIRSRIDEAIHLQDKLLLLLSEHSLVSTWIKHEVEAAFEKEEKLQRFVLFPVRLDDAVMQTIQAWAATLRRTRHIGDFTRWAAPQEYQQAFERLLRDLKAEP
jgi:uncharacterized protein YjbI with pentapeptide repeats